MLSAHTLGMFALSPISGRLTDRFGSVPTIFPGTAVLAMASVLAAAAPADGGFVLLLALFLLGWGWNLGFVAGSAMLSQNLELHERTRVQGVADALDLERERGGQPRLGADHGRRRLHGPRDPRAPG